MAAAVESSIPQSFLSYRRWRYLKACLALLGVAVAVYFAHDPVGPRSGDTWVGYALGAVAAGLVLWLTWLGVRKRSYRESQPSLTGWLSAHVYLGVTLLLLVPLHSGFQVGWNVHTLAYALICGVVVSGVFGVWMYAVTPGSMTANRRGRRIESFYEEIADLDHQIMRVATVLPDRYAEAAHVSMEETRIGGGLWRQLSGRDPSCGTRRALDALDRLQKQPVASDLIDDAARLGGLLSRKAGLLVRVRLDVRHQALLGTWLLLHVPLSMGALAAVATHVFAVFYYW